MYSEEKKNESKFFGKEKKKLVFHVNYSQLKFIRPVSLQEKRKNQH